MPLLKATQNDFEDIMALAEIWDEEEENLDPTDPQRISDYIQNGMVFLYKDEESEETLGAMIFDENYDYINLRTFYVHPDYRSDGLGKQMLERFTNMLDKNALSAFLEVESHNPVVSLYERYGFKENGDIKNLESGHIGMWREPN